MIGHHDEAFRGAAPGLCYKDGVGRSRLAQLGQCGKTGVGEPGHLVIVEDAAVDGHHPSLADCPIVGGASITKVLIANRGEIAVRVARACRDLGITSVAVYSEADRGARHVRAADEAYFIGGTQAAESYLSVERLLDAVSRSGADAVHPGYGFLAENAGFARAVTGAGVCWVGPPPDAIEIMGDKISSRTAAVQAGVTPVPGTDQALTGPGEVIEFGDAVGWPVAIKAAFGGGGRGMRVVASPAEAAEALESAQREAVRAFGRPECYLEKYLTWPRHIEVQVFGDDHGNMVHLGTRDCSVQRRHQKLVEEAPAPNLARHVTEAMGEAAVRLARACGYVNAGTVELIYQEGEFYFLEMNTRLQVEHPVTEMVTGLDLVALQFLVASGQPLPFSQDDVAWHGHAIEARINAEDPARGSFAPSPGRITRLRAPSGPWVRTDSGYETDDVVDQHYDNLLAKVVAWGPDRESARRRLVRALNETEVEGVATTVPAHLAVLGHPDFISVSHSTTWLAQSVDLSSIEPAPTAAPAGGEERKDVQVEVQGRRYEVSVWVPAGHETTTRRAARRPGGRGAGRGGAGSSRGPAGREATDGPGTPGGGTVTVPMQGTVVKVLVKVGDRVGPGQTVCVLEAMKMENNIVSEVAGTVAEVRVEAGQSVGSGDIIAVITPSGNPSS
jgi:acetyl-CoA/propionyl-CoA carboxylase biotin carboxyl carrier protein